MRLHTYKAHSFIYIPIYTHTRIHIHMYIHIYVNLHIHLHTETTKTRTQNMHIYICIMYSCFVRIRIRVSIHSCPNTVGTRIPNRSARRKSQTVISRAPYFRGPIQPGSDRKCTEGIWYVHNKRIIVQPIGKHIHVYDIYFV